jgi:hypothetical protein
MVIVSWLLGLIFISNYLVMPIFIQAEQSSRTSDKDAETRPSTVQWILDIRTKSGPTHRSVSHPIDQTSEAVNIWTNFCCWNKINPNSTVSGTNAGIPFNVYVWRPGSGVIGLVFNGTTAATSRQGSSRNRSSSSCNFSRDWCWKYSEWRSHNRKNLTYNNSTQYHY